MQKQQPYHKVNIYTGTEASVIAKDDSDVSRFVKFIKKAERPLLVIGAQATKNNGLGRPLGEYAIEMAKAAKLPICATAHSQKMLIERDVFPESNYDLIEILSYLKKENWKGVEGKGNHDLVIFLGFRSDLLEQGLSTLRHFAPHLKTMTLDNYIHPHANYSLPNFLKKEKWKQFLEHLIEVLKATGDEKQIH